MTDGVVSRGGVTIFGLLEGVSRHGLSGTSNSVVSGSSGTEACQFRETGLLLIECHEDAAQSPGSQKALRADIDDFRL